MLAAPFLTVRSGVDDRKDHGPFEHASGIRKEDAATTLRDDMDWRRRFSGKRDEFQDVSRRDTSTARSCRTPADPYMQRRIGERRGLKNTGETICS
jgi:hypothetical protein